MKNESTGLVVVVCIYYIAIIVITCYMAVNYSLWWLLLLGLSGWVKVND